MSSLEIILIPCLSDNYAYLIRDDETKCVAVVDPSEEDPVLAALETRGWQLDYILNTHHHWDHTGGNPALKKATGCKIVGARTDQDRIPGIDLTVADGEVFFVGAHQAQILEIPGHTRGHIAFYFPATKALFSGDTLFTMGCGRVFEGTFEQMWASLDRLRQLPADTLIYCGHEYTLKNTRFALTLEPNNPALQERWQAVQAQRNAHQATVPATLGLDLATNPFLRPESPEIQAQLGMTGHAPAAVFAKIRQLKDAY